MQLNVHIFELQRWREISKLKERKNSVANQMSEDWNKQSIVIAKRFEKEKNHGDKQPYFAGLNQYDNLKNY